MFWNLVISNIDNSMKEVLYEVRCLKSSEDMILALAGQLIVQQVRGSYLIILTLGKVEVFK